MPFCGEPRDDQGCGYPVMYHAKGVCGHGHHSNCIAEYNRKCEMVAYPNNKYDEYEDDIEEYIIEYEDIISNTIDTISNRCDDYIIDKQKQNRKISLKGMDCKQVMINTWLTIKCKDCNGDGNGPYAPPSHRNSWPCCVFKKHVFLFCIC